MTGALSSGVTCTPPPRDPPPGPLDPPIVSVTLNAVEDSLNDLLIVPPTGFVMNVAWQPVDTPVVPSTLWVGIERSDGSSFALFGLLEVIDGDRAVGIYRFIQPLPMGSYRFIARISDEDGSEGSASLPFAVRPHEPPIGSDQTIWLDFDADRDAYAGPDFDVDLRVFGFVSASAPALHAEMRARVIEALLDRLAEAYFDGNPNGLPGGDPIAVSFVTEDEGLPSTTRICVGGSAGIAGFVGSILLDPDNANRASVECSTLPPTGIFPRGLTTYASSPGFVQYIGPLRPASGGTAVGDDPLDALVLDPGFDPAGASEAALARLAEIENAVRVFGDVLGSIIAHETGHALGLVPPAAPGIGLHGGVSGPEYTHDVDASGATPAGNFLMNAGNTFTFESLGGLDGHAMPAFRALDHAYLRDRAVIDPLVTAILPPPLVTSVSPNLITTSLQTITITGSGFVATPAVRVVREGFVHNAYSEVLVSSTEMRATVSKSSLYPGTYTLELTNPDGQWTELAGALVVP